MLDGGLIAEADRQFSICNACRYCEGVCAVFPAMELHSAFSGEDVSYLANLCHDCRACVYVCPFADPHEFAIDIPALMAAGRLETFEQHSRPRRVWGLVAHPRSVAGVILASLLFYLLVALLAGSPNRLFHVHRGAQSFYQIVSYLWLLIPAGLMGLFAFCAIVAGVLSMAAQTPGGRSELLRGSAHRRALVDALQLRNLRGGGGGCAYPSDRTSSIRRRLHHAVFYGFALMFASTVSAAVEQDILGTDPPYPLVSVPVLCGAIGGLLTVGGCLGFLTLGLQAHAAGKSVETRRMDRLFTATLLAATATGLLTLLLRSTAALGPILLIHLAVLGGFFITLPYSKFVHWAYRYTALVRSHVESDRARTAESPDHARAELTVLAPGEKVES